MADFNKPALSVLQEGQTVVRTDGVTGPPVPLVIPKDGKFLVQVRSNWTPERWLEWELQVAKSTTVVSEAKLAPALDKFKERNFSSPDAVAEAASTATTWGAWETIARPQAPTISYEYFVPGAVYTGTASTQSGTTQFVDINETTNTLPKYKFRYRMKTAVAETGWSPESGAAQPIALTAASSIYGDLDGGIISAGSITSVALGSNALFSLYSSATLSGGGNITWDGVYFKWSSRFITISAGQSSNTALSGYFEINMPTSGPVNLHGYGATGGRSWNANGMPVSGWETLWYELPLGRTLTSLPGNFHVVAYGANWDIPANWVLIYAHQGDNGTLKLGNGRTLDYWRAATMGANSWQNYNGGYQTARYKKVGELVVVEGLIYNTQGGTAGIGATAFNLGAGYRPVGGQLLFPSNTNTGEGRVDVATTGDVIPQSGGNVYFGLDAISFPAAA